MSPTADALDAAVRLARVRRRMFGRVIPPSIGEFDVLHKLGEGGMGVVYAAWDPTLDRVVAIKLLREVGSQRDTDLLQREALALARLRHPNVVTLYAVGRHEDRVFLAMEYIDGATLREWLAGWRRGREGRDLGRLWNVFIQAAEGLSAAHEAGLIHRDIKPENLMIGVDGRLQLTDFGIARLEIAMTPPAAAAPRERAALSATVSGSGFVGTPGYVAPEVVRGAPPGPAADQYGLCVCLYEALVGKRPENRTLQLDAVPARARALLQRGLADAPQDRWPSMAELATALRRVAWPRRPRRTVAFAVAGASLVGAAAVVLLQPRPCRDADVQLGGAWSEARRDVVAANLQDAVAEQAVRTILGRLDAQAEKWRDAYGGACEATRVTGSQSEAALERSLWCLGRRRAELDAITAHLESVEPKAEALEAAVQSVERLEPVEVCRDLAYLQSELPIPADPALREEVATAREELDRLRAARAFGTPIRPSLARLRERAAAIGFRPLEAEIEHTEATTALHQEAGLEELERTALDALDIAEETGYRRLAASTWIRLTLVAADRGDADAFEFRRRRAEVAVRRDGNAPQMLFALEHTLGTGAYRLHDADAAIEHFERALELHPQARDSEDLDLAAITGGYANALLLAGRLEEAAARHDRAVAIAHRILGPDHPAVAAHEINAVSVAMARGDMDDALARIERALAVFDRAGEHGMLPAIALRQRAVIHHGRREFEAALADARVAHRLLRETLGPTAAEVRALQPFVATLLRATNRCEEAIGLLDGILAAPETLQPPVLVGALLDRATCRRDSDPDGARSDVDAAETALASANIDATPYRRQIEVIRAAPSL